MMGVHYYILDGHKAIPESDILKWATAFGKTDRHVAETFIGNKRVSTVFLGIDHSFSGGMPLLFETMVFAPDEDSITGQTDLDMERYSTWEEAERGHAAMVKKHSESLGIEGKSNGIIVDKK